MNHILENLDSLTGSGNKNFSQTLEELRGAINNKQSRYIGNIGNARHRTKKHNTKSTTQEATRISNIGATKTSGVNPGTHEGHTVPVSHKTPAKIYLYQAISLIID